MRQIYTFLFILSLVISPFLCMGQNYFQPGAQRIEDCIPNYNPFITLKIIYTFEKYDNAANEDIIVLKQQIVDNSNPYYSDNFNVYTSGYIKSEGEKVYVKKDLESEWLLLYDFGLHAGEGKTFYSTLNRVEYNQAYLVCEEVVESNPEYNGLSTMTMVPYDKETNTPIPATFKRTWIKGVGNVRGILDNWDDIYSMDGGGSNTLIEFTFDGEKIYEKETAGINQAEISDDLELDFDGNILVISGNSHIPYRIYSIDGRLITIAFAGIPTILPGKGIYIVTTGNIRKKILVK